MAMFNNQMVDPLVRWLSHSNDTFLITYVVRAVPGRCGNGKASVGPLLIIDEYWWSVAVPICMVKE